MHRFWRTMHQHRSPGGRLALLAGLAIALATPSTALGHSGPAPVPETLWTTWNVDPLVMLVLALAVWVYIRGVRAIWARAGYSRGVRAWQVAAGLGGYLTIAIALISPLDPLSSALFSAHMGQHVLLITIAPLLLILSDVSAASVWALPASWRRQIPGFWRRAGFLNSVWSVVARPLPALALHSLAIWVWHVPSFYNVAIRNELIHGIEHLTMFGTAALFWWIVIRRGREAGLSYGIGLLLLFGLVLQKTGLGALISFSPTPWYTEYSATTAAWGLSPAEDQQLAGAVLMGPGGLIYLMVGVTLFAGWVQAVERSVDRREAYIDATLVTGHGSEQGTKETV